MEEQPEFGEDLFAMTGVLAGLAGVTLVEGAKIG